MKYLELTLLVFVFAKAAGSNDCHRNAEKLPCDNLRSSEGFEYSLPANISCFRNPLCEEGWYYQNGTFIVDPNESERRLPIAVNVTSESLTVKDCVDLQWQLECHKCNCVINYTVTGSQAPGGKQNPANDDNVYSAGIPYWGIAFIVSVAVGVPAAAFVIWYRNTHRSNENGVV